MYHDRKIHFSLTLVCLFLLSGCEQENDYKPSPPPEVTVSKPVVSNVEDYVEFTGTTEAYKKVEIRARVKGFLESVNFKEGDFVEKDQLLFTIDPRSFQAQVDQAKADHERTKVQLEKADDTFQRMKKLFEKQATNEQDYLQAKAVRDGAATEVLRSKAALQDAELNLSYTKVTSPIAGRIGKFEVNVGNLVGDGQATLLTTVVSIVPIFAYFNVSEQQLLYFIRKDEIDNGPKEANRSLSEKKKIPISLALADEPDFSHEGYIDYADYELDTASGTFLVRGIFPNEKGLIVPGLFVRLRLADKSYDDAVLVNENAFSADMIGRYLYIVNSENKVEKRYFPKETLGALVNGFRIVLKGLSAEEYVVVNGIQRARDGIVVVPKKVVTTLPESMQKADSGTPKPKSEKSSSPKKPTQPPKNKKAEKPPAKPAQK